MPHANAKRYERRFDPEAIRQRTKQRLIRYGLSSLALAVLIVGLGIAAMVAITGPETTREQFDWGVLEGLAGLASLAVVIGGAVFVAKEYIDSEMQGTLVAAEAAFNMYKDIFGRITDPEETAARRWIILNIEPLDPGADREARVEWLRAFMAQLKATPPDWAHELPPGHWYLKRVLNSLDFLGYVEEHYWELEDDLVEWLSPPVAKVWERIGPYVEYEAHRRAEPDFYKSARVFGEKCVRYRDAKGYSRSRIIDQGT